MKILIVDNGKIPVFEYGGTQRVIWCLGKELVKLGFDVSFLVKEGSFCDFAKVYHIDQNKSIIEQIPKGFDLIHFNFKPKDIEKIDTPYLITMHGNINNYSEFDKNTVFVSKNHASRYNSTSFVHNGLDWDEYDKPELKNNRKHFHFLANAAWRVKNVSGAINMIKQIKNEKLKVMGGYRLNLRMGFRFTLSPKISFAGMVGGDLKFSLLNASKGLIFPVRWHEPFGLAIIESLYYGCPVFGTPYGSLPELIPSEVGFLSNNSDELIEPIKNYNNYSRNTCHEYARDNFNSEKMALEYLKKYETIVSGKTLNQNPPKLIQKQEQKWLEWN